MEMGHDEVRVVELIVQWRRREDDRLFLPEVGVGESAADEQHS
jgi:hypothetical protein